MVGDLSFVYCHFNQCYTDLMIKMYSTIQTNVTPDKQYFDKNVPRLTQTCYVLFCLSILNWFYQYTKPFKLISWYILHVKSFLPHFNITDY